MESVRYMAGAEGTSVEARAYIKVFYVASGSQLTIEKYNGDNNYEK